MYFVIDCDGEVGGFKAEGDALQVAQGRIADLKDASFHECADSRVWDGWCDEVNSVVVAKVTHRATLVNPEAHYTQHDYQMRPVEAQTIDYEQACRELLRSAIECGLTMPHMHPPEYFSKSDFNPMAAKLRQIVEGE